MTSIKDSIETAVQRELEHLPFSGVISVRKGQTLFEQAFGLANRSDLIPNTPLTRFGIASGSKVFTAVAVCQLIQEGRLEYETRLQDCVDARFPNFHSDITVRHLLTHTSGITSYFEEDVDDDYEALWKDTPVYSLLRPQDFLPLFQDKPQKFPPGDHFEYNDGGFVLLGLIVEQVSGSAFTEYVHDHVFKPAGMLSSGCFRMDQLPGHCATGIIEEGDSWRSNIYAVPVLGGGDGGAFTTAGDMHCFWDALLASRLLDEAGTRLLLTPHVRAESEGPDFWYGFGVWIRGDEYCLQGWDPGVSFLSTFQPEETLSITLLSNTNRSLWAIHREICASLEDL